MTVIQQISKLLSEAVSSAQNRGLIPSQGMPPVSVERPQKTEHGDFACSYPLRIAKLARRSPMEIAQDLIECIPESELIESVTPMPPGFINLNLDSKWLQNQIGIINDAAGAYGSTEFGENRSIQIEFVSVNPTGPVHVGHARGAVLGSTLANVLDAAGFRVTREYYVNDAGTQMDLFYASTYARYAQSLGHDEEEMPENGYIGQYLVTLGHELAKQEGSKYLSIGRDEARKRIGAIALEHMLENIRADLSRIGVDFDVWFREHSLFTSGQFDAALASLQEGGYTAERDGALWFTSSALGEEKDNVIVRSSGQPTYFASDIAYHRGKLGERGFDQVIDVWGADHQGHVSRMKAVLRALGIDDQRLTIIISQLVTLKNEGDIVRASKRSGQIVTLSDLVDAVGADACRYFFLSRAPESQMEFDLALATRQSNDNPVYYVQYAHARVAGILRQATERGLKWSGGDFSLLTHTAEHALIRKMLELPEVVNTIASTLAPHSLPHYAIELASAFHWFYDHCRVLTTDEQQFGLMEARLQLVQATKLTLARTLNLMGVSTPEIM